MKISMIALDERGRRIRIWGRDGGVCGICRVPISLDDLMDVVKVNVDHIRPRSHGGPSHYLNLQMTHVDCNSAKGDRCTGCEQCEQPDQHRIWRDQGHRCNRCSRMILPSEIAELGLVVGKYTGLLRVVCPGCRPKVRQWTESSREDQKMIMWRVTVTPNGGGSRKKAKENYAYALGMLATKFEDHDRVQVTGRFERFVEVDVQPANPMDASEMFGVHDMISSVAQQLGISGETEVTRVRAIEDAWVSPIEEFRNTDATT